MAEWEKGFFKDSPGWRSTSEKGFFMPEWEKWVAFWFLDLIELKKKKNKSWEQFYLNLIENAIIFNKVKN